MSLLYWCRLICASVWSLELPRDRLRHAGKLSENLPELTRVEGSLAVAQRRHSISHEFPGIPCRLCTNRALL